MFSSTLSKDYKASLWLVTWTFKPAWLANFADKVDVRATEQLKLPDMSSRVLCSILPLWC